MILALQRYVFAGILTIWGILLVFFCLSGRVGSYLHPTFHPWVLGAGVLLLLMAGGLLIFAEAGEDCCEPGCSQCGRTPFGLVIMAFILVVPPVVACFVSPSQFGANAVLNRGVVSDLSSLPAYQPYKEPPLPGEEPQAQATPASTGADYIPRNASGQIKAEPIDLLYAVEEPAMRTDFENKEIEMIGQFMPAKGNNASGKRFSLVKMFIVCCAADARPVAVAVETPQGLNVPDMTWVRVVGRATFPIEGGRMIPVIVAQSVERCDPPQDTFIYN